MGRGATALLGAAAGAAVGVLVLVLTHPTAAYTNDAYREGATFGFLLRYVTLGLLAALLIRALRRRTRTALAGIGLAVVLALAIVPPLLDTQTESEKRRAAAVAEDDPAQRDAAEVRAGAIDGCVDSTKRELEGTPEEGRIDADKYCTCFIDAIVAGPENDAAELEAMAIEVRSGAPTPKLERAATRCAKKARSG
jgi:hypothetical protein